MFAKTGFCVGPVELNNQFYRVISSAFSHANPSHIIFNMCSLIYSGYLLEGHYGTWFYASLHLWICIIG
jgi:membrane associated rhomboid family serine protease